MGQAVCAAHVGRVREGIVLEEDVLTGDDDHGDEPPRGLIGYFIDRPARFFGLLGSIVFVLGWAGVIYLAFFSDVGASSRDTYFTIQLLVALGSSVTLTSGVLWGVGAYIWLHLLPEPPEDR
jgi:hypothetical protein